MNVYVVIYNSTDGQTYADRVYEDVFSTRLAAREFINTHYNVLSGDYRVEDFEIIRKVLEFSTTEA